MVIDEAIGNLLRGVAQLIQNADTMTAPFLVISKNKINVNSFLGFGEENIKNTLADLLSFNTVVLPLSIKDCIVFEKDKMEGVYNTNYTLNIQDKKEVTVIDYNRELKVNVIVTDEFFFIFEILRKFTSDDFFNFHKEIYISFFNSDVGYIENLLLKNITYANIEKTRNKSVSMLFDTNVAKEKDDSTGSKQNVKKITINRIVEGVK